MTYRTYSPIAGTQPIATADTVANQALGQRVQATDPTYGDGQFIYLVGVTSTVVGSLVTYNTTTYQTTLITTASKSTGAPVAVAMSACTYGKWGWYQVAGNAVIKKTSVAVTPGVAIYISGTAGRIKVLASAGQQIEGARTANLATIVTTTSTVVVTINNPHVEGQ